MSLARREPEIDGCVNFPVDDKSFLNTLEGGMFVKLVVVSNPDKYGMCCGVGVSDILSEAFIGDDKIDDTVSDEDLMTHADGLPSMLFHFPNMGRRHEDDKFSINSYISREYLAVVILGSTGWSGWIRGKTEDFGEGAGYWRCQYSDLTDKGKELYKMLEDLWPGCSLHILTFLDT